MFAQRGIEAVSFRDLVTASGQRNVSAVTYHFGSREGLLRAIVEPMLEQLRAIVEAAEQQLHERRVHDHAPPDGVVAVDPVPLGELRRLEIKRRADQGDTAPVTLRGRNDPELENSRKGKLHHGSDRNVRTCPSGAGRAAGTGRPETPGSPRSGGTGNGERRRLEVRGRTAEIVALQVFDAFADEEAASRAITAETAAQNLARLTTTLEYGDLRDADL